MLRDFAFEENRALIDRAVENGILRADWQKDGWLLNLVGNLDSIAETAGIHKEFLFCAAVESVDFRIRKWAKEIIDGSQSVGRGLIIFESDRISKKSIMCLAGNLWRRAVSARVMTLNQFFGEYEESGFIKQGQFVFVENFLFGAPGYAEKNMYRGLMDYFLMRNRQGQGTILFADSATNLNSVYDGFGNHLLREFFTLAQLS